MSISVRKERRAGAAEGRDAWVPSVRLYAGATGFCLVFSAVYEFFSHGVISAWMVCLALVPLLVGLLPSLVFGLMGGRAKPLARELWACGVLTLTVGCCLMGVLEIYGTTSPYVSWYLPIGVALLLLAVACQLMGRAARQGSPAAPPFPS